MAQYVLRNAPGVGITFGHAAWVRANAATLVRQAVAVPWNEISVAPAGFPMQLIDGAMRPIHTGSGVNIEYKAGFRMAQHPGSQKWENHCTLPGYRLDLQSIENGWANWAVQTNGQNSHTVATCLMKVHEKSDHLHRIPQIFSQGQLVEALKRSAAAQNQLCELTQV